MKHIVAALALASAVAGPAFAQVVQPVSCPDGQDACQVSELINPGSVGYSADPCALTCPLQFDQITCTPFGTDECSCTNNGAFSVYVSLEIQCAQ